MNPRKFLIGFALASLVIVAVTADEVDDYLAERPMLAQSIARGGGPLAEIRGSNITQYINPATHTNAIAVLGYGSLNLPNINAGQGLTGNDNGNNGIQWWGTGWDGSLNGPLSSATPEMAIRGYANWGGGGYEKSTMHIYSRYNIRIEPGFGGPETYGYGYLALGNEDANNWNFVNYANGSTRTNNGFGPNQGTWVRGHGQPLFFEAWTFSNGVQRAAIPAIVAWGGATNDTPQADGLLKGELWFYRHGPVPDFGQPTYGVQTASSTDIGGKMTTTGWELHGTTRTTNLVVNQITGIANDVVTTKGYIHVGDGTGGRYWVVDNSGVIPTLSAHEHFIHVYNGNRNWGYGLANNTTDGTGLATYNMAATRHQFIYSGTDGTRVDFDLANNTNTISGYTVFTNGVGTAKATVALAADNQVIGATTNAFLFVSSDNGTAGNRTFVLTTGIDGKIIRLAWSGTNAGELVDDSANSGSGNVRLSATWTPTQYDTLTLIGVGNDWYELARSAN